MKTSESRSSSGSDGEGISRAWRDDSPSHGYTSYGDNDDSYWRSRYGYGPSWSIGRFFRRLFGMGGDSTPHRLTPAELTRLAREGHDLHPMYCHQSVAHVTDRLGIAGLSGKPADDQIAYMRQNWSTTDAQAAQAQANQGAIVVAGLGGHTAIVTPGPGAVRLDGFYPNVTCGGPETARSDGSKTAGDVWPVSDRPNIEYFAAP